MAFFSSTPIGWTTFYDRNKRDGGGIQRLFEASLAALSSITTSHFKKPDKLVETIASSTYANMIMVAGDNDGAVHLLHHGFVNATAFGGEASLLFLSENSSEAPVKSLSHASAVLPIKTGLGRTRGVTIDSPSLGTMLRADSENDFANLRGEGNTILRDKPNHMMIGPSVFSIAEGAQRIQAKTLAFRIICRINEGTNSLVSGSGGDQYSTIGTLAKDTNRDEQAGSTDADHAISDTPSINPRPTTNDVIDILDSKARPTRARKGKHVERPDEIEIQRPRGGAGVNLQEVDGTRTARDDGDRDDDRGDAGSIATQPDDAAHIEHLLAWLWACEKKMVPSPKLDDPIYDTTLISRIRGIRSKLHADGTPRPRAPNADGDDSTRWPNPHTPRGNGNPASTSALRTAGGVDESGLSNLALTTKEIAGVLERMENNRRMEQKKKESDKSFLRNIGTMQRDLFSSLCTDEIGEIPEHPPFLKGLMDTKTPQKAIAMIRSEIWEWEGSFFDGPFHRFLANGYLSRDGKKGSPGGFTLFMFCPKNVEASLNTNKSDIALLRDYFGLDVDDDTISHYARQGWFYPSNHYDLRVQLKTACAMLDLLTGEGSIGSHGLSYILSPTRWDRYAPLIAERFKTENLFGAKFVYCLDRNLQVFFAKLTKWDPDDPLSLDPNYLRKKAEGLLDKIDDGNTLGTILPLAIYGPAGAKRAIEQEAAASGGEGPHKKGRPSPNKQIAPAGRSPYSGPLTTAALLESAEVTNTQPVPEWLLPRGSLYYDFFISKDKSTRGWPLLDDIRLPNGHGPACIRFQTTGKCRAACRMAHVLPDMIPADIKRRIGERLKEAYGSRGAQA